MVEMYAEIGLEVHLEPFNVENESGCSGCMQLKPDLFKTLYTRRKFGHGMIKDEWRIDAIDLRLGVIHVGAAFQPRLSVTTLE